MAKQRLNHSRNLSTRYRVDNYYYDIERSKATAKQIKFYQRLWYMFKNNGLDIKEEVKKREISSTIITNPTGRAEYSEAISTMISILEDLGLYKTEKASKEFELSYNVQVDGGGGVIRSWQSIKRFNPEEGDIDGKQDKDRVV